MTKKKEDLGGVWRTVGGRRIFIKDGQDLYEAMNDSGKFTNLKRTNSQRKKEYRIVNGKDNKVLATFDEDQYEEGYKKMREMGKELKAKGEEDNLLYKEYKVDGKTISEQDLRKEFDKELEKGNIEKGTTYHDWKKGIVDDRNSNVKSEYSKKDTLTELRKADNWNDINSAIDNIKDEKLKTMMKKEAQKLEENENGAWKSADYLAREYNFYKEDFERENKEKYEYELYKKAREDENSIDPMTENSTDWEELDRKYKDRYEKEFPLLKKHGLDKDEKFRYMMLSRMQSDADYYLGNGNKNAKNLWAKDEEEHIGLMKELYDSVSEKPDWLSQEQLNKYEKELSYEKYKRNSIYTDKNGAKIGHSMVVQYATMNHLTIEEAKRILGVK